MSCVHDHQNTSVMVIVFAYPDTPESVWVSLPSPFSLTRIPSLSSFNLSRNCLKLLDVVSSKLSNVVCILCNNAFTSAAAGCVSILILIGELLLKCGRIGIGTTGAPYQSCSLFDCGCYRSESVNTPIDCWLWTVILVLTTLIILWLCWLLVVLTLLVQWQQRWVCWRGDLSFALCLLSNSCSGSGGESTTTTSIVITLLTQSWLIHVVSLFVDPICNFQW